MKRCCPADRRLSFGRATLIAALLSCPCGWAMADEPDGGPMPDAGPAPGAGPVQGDISVSSDRSRERHLLLRFIAEMEAAEMLLQEASGIAESADNRRYFDYHRLTEDLQLMRFGIIDYLRQSGAMRPRSFAPLSGQYSEEK